MRRAGLRITASLGRDVARRLLPPRGGAVAAGGLALLFLAGAAEPGLSGRWVRINSDGTRTFLTLHHTGGRVVAVDERNGADSFVVHHVGGRRWEGRRLLQTDAAWARACGEREWWQDGHVLVDLGGVLEETFDAGLGDRDTCTRVGRSMVTQTLRRRAPGETP